MTQEEIIEMARQVCDIYTDKRGRNTFLCDEYGLEAFAKLVAAKEREACAKMFDGAVWAYDYREIAAAIRARGEA